MSSEFPVPRWYRSLRFWVDAWLWFCAIVFVLARLTAEYTDYAFVNVVMFFCVVLGGLAWASWFTFTSRQPWSIRLLPWIVILVVNLAFWPFVKVKHLTGELVPVFTWRWKKDADNELGKLPEASTAGKPATVSPPSTPEPTPQVEDGEYAQFLGPGRRNYRDDIRLARDWKAQPPRLLWKQPIGAGWSAFAVANGFAVTLEQRGEQELVSCYRLQTGEPVWSQAAAVRHYTVPGGVGPRSTPTIADGKVYAVGAVGHFYCLDLATGKPFWQLNLIEKFVTQGKPATETTEEKTVMWGRAGSPLIVDDWVLVPAGGPAGGPFVSLAAFHKDTGEQAWQAGEKQISYSSPNIATLVGRRQVVLVVEDSVRGFEVGTGRELWSYDWPGNSTMNASSSQAVPLPDDRVLVTKAYGQGAALLRIESDDDGQGAAKIWHDRTLLKTKFTNVSVIGEYIYALSDGVLECVALADGKRQWKQGRYGQGQILGVGDTLLVLAETGELALVEASPKAYRELSRIHALEGQTWNNLCLAGKLLLVRNGEEAACYELATQP